MASASASPPKVAQMGLCNKSDNTNFAKLVITLLCLVVRFGAEMTCSAKTVDNGLVYLSPLGG
jgi:hypothetical protein